MARVQKKYVTADQANAMLPLVRRIVGDIVALVRDLSERHERLAQAQAGSLTDEHQAEWGQVREGLERDKERLLDYAAELQQLGVYLKDPYTGLVDFPCWMNDHEVFLCWRLDEPEVAHWHEIDAGFAGRQKLNLPCRSTL